MTLITGCQTDSYKFQWPEVFEKGNKEYEHTVEGKLMAIADAYCGWALCISGANIPDKFGDGMAYIANHIGGSATPDGLDDAVRKLKQP